VDIVLHGLHGFFDRPDRWPVFRLALLIPTMPDDEAVLLPIDGEAGPDRWPANLLEHGIGVLAEPIGTISRNCLDAKPSSR
jgi:hypothetical protein